jgi:hypothetical protein
MELKGLINICIRKADGIGYDTIVPKDEEVWKFGTAGVMRVGKDFTDFFPMWRVISFTQETEPPKPLIAKSPNIFGM